MRRLLPLFSCFLALACWTALLPAEELGHTTDTLDVVKKNVDEGKAVLLDVRTQAEWDRGHIADAIHVPLDQITKGTGLDVLPKDKVIYTFCEIGKRSLTAGRVLAKREFTVRVLKPGYQDLLKAGFQKGESKEK